MCCEQRPVGGWVPFTILFSHVVCKVYFGKLCKYVAETSRVLTIREKKGKLEDVPYSVGHCCWRMQEECIVATPLASSY